MHPEPAPHARGLTFICERADDLVQDALERVWSKWSPWQQRGEVRASMFGIMRNQFIDRRRA